MSWRRKEPGPQQPWYCPSWTVITRSPATLRVKWYWKNRLVPLQWHHVSTKASQMTAGLIVCSTACSDQQQRTFQSCVLTALYEGNSLVISGFISLGTNNVVMWHTFPCPDIILTKATHQNKISCDPSISGMFCFLLEAIFGPRVMSLPVSVCPCVRMCVCINQELVRMITHH